MGLDMYAFSLTPSEEIPTTDAIARYRLPPATSPLPSNFSVTCLDVCGLGAAVQTMHQQILDAFLASVFVLPGSTLIHDWTGHPDLHAWMQRLWRVRRRPNPNAIFSLHTPIGLDTSALDALEHAVRQGQLPPGSGPFFGESDGSEREDDLAFIAMARAEIAQGRLVYYTSWW